MTTEKKKKFIIDLAFLLIVATLIYITFKFLLIYLFPFLIGLVLTSVMQKPAGFISRKIKLPKGICALVLVIFAFVAIITIVAFLGYKIFDFVSSFAARAPQLISEWSGIFDNLKALLGNASNKLPDGFELDLAKILSDFITSMISQIAKWAPTYAASVATKLPGVLVSVIITFVASCYIAKDFETVKKFVVSHVKPSWYNMFIECKSILIVKTFKIVKSYLILMVINFAEVSLGLLLFGVKNAVMIAAGIAILDVLPVLGTGTVLIPWSLISLINGNYGLALGLIILYIITVIVRNLIEPKIVGGQVGLHPLITLISIFTGLRLFGVFGMLCLPLVIIMLYSLYKDGKFDFIKSSN